MDDRFDDYLQKIEAERIDARPELDEWAGDQLTDARAEMLQFQRDQAYRRFLVRFLSEEHDRLNDPDHDRSEPLCTCGNNCYLMQGKLPPTVLDGRTIAEGIEEYAHEHNGSPTGLFEADRAYREAIGSLLGTLERIWTALKNDQIPQSGREGTEVEYAGT